MEYVTIPVLCKVCKGIKLVDCNPEGVIKWHNGEHIQDALPELTDGERELLLSGICEECFDRLFKED